MELVVDILLVSLIVLMIIIAYQKFIKILSKNHINKEEYCVLYNTETFEVSGEVEFYFQCPHEMNVAFKIWSYEDKEIFTLEESIKYFNLEGIGKSPSKLDMSRILSMNEHYIKNIDEKDLFNQLINYCQIYKNEINKNKKDKIQRSLVILKNKAKTLEDIFNNCQYIVNDEVIFNKEDLTLIDNKAKKIISEFYNKFKEINELNRESLEPIIQDLIKSNETNFKGVGQPLRIALTGSKFGPGIYDIIISLGKDDVEKRLVNEVFS